MTRLPLARLCVISTAAWCAACPGVDDSADDDATADTPDGGATCPAPGPAAALLEDRAVYDDAAEVLTVELIVDDLDGLADVEADVPGAEVAAIFRQGDVGAGATAPNATLELRGATSRLALQKSYKVKLDDETWLGQRELNLNKHPYDLTRARQRVSFALFRTVPGFTSLRTRLVHLFLNGEDRGLYTHVEEPDRRFLASHGLDPGGALYKAQFFFFLDLDEAVVHDPAQLDPLLQAKANPDPARLLRMIRAVNDPARDIDEVIATHFDRDNYLSWLALNLLLGNFDTRSQNYLLYGPAGCERWYFLPWDYDGALGWDTQPGTPPRSRWLSGLGTYWGISLHERFLRVPANVDALRATMARLRAGPLADAAIAAPLDADRDVIRAYALTPPDLWNLPTYPIGRSEEEKRAQWEAAYARLYGAIAALDAEFEAVRGRPMPVWLFHLPTPAEVIFQWSASYQLDGHGVTYDFMLGTSPGFEPETLVLQRPGLVATMTTEALPPSGVYYWRVVTRSVARPAEDWQVPFFDAATLEVP